MQFCLLLMFWDKKKNKYYNSEAERHNIGTIEIGTTESVFMWPTGSSNRRTVSGPTLKCVPRQLVALMRRVCLLATNLVRTEYFLKTNNNRTLLIELQKSQRNQLRAQRVSFQLHAAGRRHMSTEAKRLRADRMAGKKIGTHNGTFHCDEVLACFFLQQLPEYKDAEIVRTRDSALLAGCDIVVDVGGEFDPLRHRYDHHQRTFTETFHSLSPEKPWVTKLSSAGLVYLHFGRQLLAQLTQLKEDDKQLEVLYDKLYENFVEEVDAVDNGISQSDGEARYAISTTLSARVGHLNPRWNSKSQDTEEGFKKALALVGAEFLDRLDFYMSCWLPARQVVEDAINERHKVDPSGQVMEFFQGGCPWKEHLFSLEKELQVETPIKYVLYSDQNGQWRVQCVPAGLNTFQSRLPLLEEWRGIRDDELSQLSGIEGCVFVHASGFIGGNKTREGALEMARRTLQAASKSSANGDC